MKKTIFILAFFCATLLSNAQLTKSLDLSAISGADTSLWFTYDQSKYSYDLGITALFESVTGTGGTWEVLNSPTDTISIVMAGTSRVVNSDTAFAIISDVTPLERLGFKFTTGSVSAGTLTVYFSRKTKK